MLQLKGLISLGFNFFFKVRGFIIHFSRMKGGINKGEFHHIKILNLSLSNHGIIPE